MSSSTSNSKAVNGKILLAMILVMGGAVLLMRLLYLAMGADANNIMGRVVEAREALPQIVKEPDDLMIFFGSSMVEAGFSPRQFDRELRAKDKTVKSFNFGFGGLNPYFQDYLSRRIRDEFLHNQRRIKLVVIEFNPFQTTTTRWQGANDIVDSFLTMLASDAELWEIAQKDPERGALLFNIKYLRNDISAEMFSSYIGRQIFPQPQPIKIEEPKELIELRSKAGQQLTERFEQDYPNYTDADWYYPWQGGGTIPEERSPETLEWFKKYYSTFQNSANKENARQRRIASADIEGLHFEPLLVDSFINIVNNFQEVADHVEVVIMPRQVGLINYSEAAQTRLNKVVAEIENATGVSIINQQELPQFTADMYRDATHFTRYHGDVEYTRLTVETFAHYFEP